MTWLRNHMRGQLFQLGRLQHQLNEFQCDARVYRHRADGTVITLSEGGIRLRDDVRWGSQVYRRQVYLQPESRILSEAATAPFGGVAPPPG